MDSLKKMTTELKDVVSYTLNINNKSHIMNDLIDSVININWSGKVICSCGKTMDSFYRSNFCYPCFWNSPLASQSIFKPELCTAHLDIEERDLAWEKDFQIAPHYVYLANSSGIKVGITRGTQGVIRWMDQGASQAIIFAQVPNRRFSGDIEVALKSHVADKTNWRKMLSAAPEKVDLVAMKNQLIYTLLLSINLSLFAQIDPKKIDIVRDAYGVPHIFAKTDAEVAYGLAWAHAEDDFTTIQQSYLAGNNLLSNHLGKKGIPADFLAQFIRSDELVERDYEIKTSPEYKRILEGYAQGINRYAATHPEEVLSQQLFPVTPKRMMRYAQLQLFISSKGDYWVSKILDDDLNYTPSKEDLKGSNTFAFNSSKTTDGETYLAINTHQPLDGPVSWYEAHLCSEEGTNILGALFAGSPNILIGANEHLAWAHTVNQPDKMDVFALEMHPKKKNVYVVDGEEYPLETFKAKLTFKVLGIPSWDYYQNHLIEILLPIRALEGSM